MITALAPHDRLPDAPPLSIRMASFWEAYGGDYPFARFWRVGEGGVLSLVDGAATVIAGEADDQEELSSFLALIGAKSVLSDVNWFGGRRLPVYRKAVTGQGSALSAPAYEAAYRLFGTVFPLPDWPAWYTDVCHRVRHGTALLVLVEQGALCAARQGSRLLLTGLAVAPDHRRQGIASRLLHAACVDGICELYAIVDDPAAAQFYEHNGFSPSGEVYYSERGPKNER